MFHQFPRRIAAIVRRVVQILVFHRLLSGVKKRPVSNRQYPRSGVLQLRPTRTGAAYPHRGVLKHILRIVAIATKALEHSHQGSAVCIEQIQKLSLPSLLWHT
jgi:hypothetical protein